jgi:peptidyl-prolyl cis-trans isomerase D
VIFLMIIAVFVLWGVEAVVRGGNALTTLASVGDHTIEPIDVQRAELNLREAYRNAYQGRFTPEMQKSLNLRQRALDGLIDRRVMMDEADRLGLRIEDQQLRDQITTSPAFQLDGRFSKDLYLRVLRASSLTPAQYEAGRREDLTVEQLQSMVEDGVSVSDAEVRDAILAKEEKVTVSLVKFRASDYTSQVETNDEDVAKYYEEHKQSYTEPERIKVEVLTYPTDKFTGGVEPSKEQITEYYESYRTSKFTQPHEVHARHILIRVEEDADKATRDKARARIDEIAAKLQAGGDFAKLAEEHSEDPGSAKKGGDLGYFGRGRMVPPFEEAVFALSPGQTSEVITTPFGFHIVRVEEVREEREKPLEEVREEIVKELKDEAARKLAEEAATQDRAAVVGGETLDAVAERRSLTVDRPAPLVRNAPLPGVGRSLPLTNAMWQLSPGGMTEPTDANGTWVVARLLEKIPATVPELDAVKDRVQSEYRLDKAKPLAVAAAESFLAAAKAEGALAGPAAAEGRKVEDSGAFVRTGAFIPGVGGSQELKDAAFALSDQNRVADKVFIVAGDAVVVQLKEKTTPTEEEITAKLDTTRKELLDQKRAAVFTRYLEELKAKTQIYVNPQLVDELPAV